MNDHQTPSDSTETATESVRAQLAERIEQKTATVAVIGLGYVGLPLLRAVFDCGYPVIGFDIDPDKIEQIKRGENYLPHLGTDLTKPFVGSDRFQATTQTESLREADVILLCVPTPLGEHREPDLSYVLDSTRMVSKTMRPGQLIVLESTTYPGTTRGDMQPILEQSNLQCGRDFFLAYSPEREDPGPGKPTTRQIPKLVAGVDDTSGDLAESFYRSIIDNVHRVSSAEIAEAAKLLENIYRAVNIALVNEMKTLLAEMNVDVWEVINAAATKPFGFQAFYPGPGLGGHCIPIDPFYLAWKARELGRSTKFIELAGEINSSMPLYVVERIATALNEHSKPVRGSRILIIGMAYKPDVSDSRESPAAEIIEQLHERGAQITYHDPHIPVFPKMRRYQFDLTSTPLNQRTLADTDCVVIVTNHSNIDYDMLGQHAKLIVDTRNAMSRVAKPTAMIIKA